MSPLSPAAAALAPSNDPLSLDAIAPAPKPFIKWVGGKRRLVPELLRQAPTRFGAVSFTMQATHDGVSGSVQLTARQGVSLPAPLVAVKIRAPDTSKPLLGTVNLEGDTGAKLLAWHPSNESAVIKLGPSLAFNFTAK